MQRSAAAATAAAAATVAGSGSVRCGSWSCARLQKRLTFAAFRGVATDRIAALYYALIRAAMTRLL